MRGVTATGGVAALIAVRIAACVGYGLPIDGVARPWYVENGLPSDYPWRITCSPHLSERAEDDRTVSVGYRVTRPRVLGRGL